MDPTGVPISVTALTKSFGPHQALRGIDLHAEPGEVTGFLGPNGSGKSTTLRCLLGLHRPDGGTALVDGRPYAQLERPTTVVGAMLDALTVDPAMSGRDHLRVYAALGGHPERRVDDCLEQLSMQHYARRALGGWSTGMRQRLGIAIALLGDPGVIVLDEPTNGLDPEGISWIRGLVRSWADEGRTVLVSTHVLAEVEDVLDAAVIIREGRTVAAGSLAELARSQGVETLEAIYATTAGSRA
ncbi:ABC transporter ATP-binding protein [Luteococcus peritonei]|uniref:ABC transporter ATP-binding protein n=1 Tax=Luteococcus peritonei TaxID=88874 RepID=A0ABW4RYG6_9ACTN